jgi:hypothetical protein
MNTKEKYFPEKMICGLHTRTYNVLRNGGFVDHNGEIDWVMVRKYVENGEIKKYRNCGQRGYNELRNALGIIKGQEYYDELNRLKELVHFYLDHIDKCRIRIDNIRQQIKEMGK